MSVTPGFAPVTIEYDVEAGSFSNDYPAETVTNVLHSNIYDSNSGDVNETSGQFSSTRTTVSHSSTITVDLVNDQDIYRDKEALTDSISSASVNMTENADYENTDGNVAYEVAGLTTTHYEPPSINNDSYVNNGTESSTQKVPLTDRVISVMDNETDAFTQKVPLTDRVISVMDNKTDAFTQKAPLTDRVIGVMDNETDTFTQVPLTDRGMAAMDNENDVDNNDLVEDYSSSSSIGDEYASDSRIGDGTSASSSVEDAEFVPPLDSVPPSKQLLYESVSNKSSSRNGSLPVEEVHETVSGDEVLPTPLPDYFANSAKNFTTAIVYNGQYNVTNSRNFTNMSKTVTSANILSFPNVTVLTRNVTDSIPIDQDINDTQLAITNVTDSVPIDQGTNDTQLLAITNVTDSVPIDQGINAILLAITNVTDSVPIDQGTNDTQLAITNVTDPVPIDQGTNDTQLAINGSRYPQQQSHSGNDTFFNDVVTNANVDAHTYTNGHENMTENQNGLTVSFQNSIGNNSSSTSVPDASMDIPVANTTELLLNYTRPKQMLTNTSNVDAANPPHALNTSTVDAANPPHDGNISTVETPHSPHAGNTSTVDAARPPHAGNISTVDAAHPPHAGNTSAVDAAHQPHAGNISTGDAAHPPHAGNISTVDAAHPPHAGNISTVDTAHSPHAGNISAVGQSFPAEGNDIPTLTNQSSLLGISTTDAMLTAVAADNNSGSLATAASSSQITDTSESTPRYPSMPSPPIRSSAAYIAAGDHKSSDYTSHDEPENSNSSQDHSYINEESVGLVDYSYSDVISDSVLENSMLMTTTTTKSSATDLPTNNKPESLPTGTAGNGETSRNSVVTESERSYKSQDYSYIDEESFGLEDYYYSDAISESENSMLLTETTTKSSATAFQHVPTYDKSNSLPDDTRNNETSSNFLPIDTRMNETSTFSTPTESEWLNNEPDFSASYDDYYDGYGDDDTQCRPASQMKNPPKDCDDVAQMMTSTLISGEHCVYPSDGQAAIRVFCHLDHNEGGWTVSMLYKIKGELHP